jgi:glutathione S-transferase
MAQYKFFYYDIRGKAEIVRLIFAAAGQEFQDVRFEEEDWLQKYIQDSPTGEAPYMELNENGKKVLIGQTMVIARFLAKRFELIGSTEIGNCMVDMFAVQAHDLLKYLIKVKRQEDKAKKAEMSEKFYNETLPKYLRIIEQRLAKISSGYIALNGFTYADLTIFTVLDELDQSLKDKILLNYPIVEKLEKNIRRHPRIALYLSKRRETLF